MGQRGQEGGEHVPRVGGVGPPGGRSQDELVPEQPRRLVGVAGAADVVQQRRVAGRPDAIVRQVEEPGEPAGERGRAQRLTGLEPEPEVGQARQPGQQVGQPHPRHQPGPRRGR
jgi:hypothetical protein